MTREEWAKRPLAEREIAAEAWCQGWNDAVDADSENLDEPERSKFTTFSPNVTDAFALDLPDVPATRAREIAAAVGLIAGDRDEWSRRYSDLVDVTWELLEALRITPAHWLDARVIQAEQAARALLDREGGG